MSPGPTPSKGYIEISNQDWISDTDLMDPEHPQWVRRRKRLTAMFIGGLVSFLAASAAMVYSAVMGERVSPELVSAMWPAGSVMAAACGIYVWQGVKRNV